MNEVKEFLNESNKIESVYDPQSLKDALSAWNYLIKQDSLTVDRILETHRILMSNLDFKIAGKLRECEVYIGGEATIESFKVPALIEGWVHKHLFDNTEQQIKDAHIRFEKIHPFVDGNGRTGRILMNWQRVKNNLPILIIREGYEQREYYKWFRE